MKAYAFILFALGGTGCGPTTFTPMPERLAGHDAAAVVVDAAPPRPTATPSAPLAVPSAAAPDAPAGELVAPPSSTTSVAREMEAELEQFRELLARVAAELKARASVAPAAGGAR